MPAAAPSAELDLRAAPAPRRLKVFLSHSSADKALARRLARDLQSAHVDIWLDQWQIGVGEYFEQRIAQGLADTDFVIVLLTRQAVASEWVNREWRELVEREAGTRRIAVLPVRAEPCELPDFLAQRSHADIAGGSYVPGFRHLLHLLRHHGDDRGIVLADAAARSEALRRQAHLLEIERIALGLDRPQAELPVMLPVVVPIGLEIAQDLIPLVEPDAQGASRALDELVPQVRDALQRQYGFAFPSIRIRGNTSDMPDGTALVLIDEVPESMFRIDSQQVVVNATPERLAALGVAAQRFDTACGRIAFVPAADRAAVQGLGLHTMDATEYLFHALFEVVRGMPHEFLGLDEVHRRVSALPPDLVQRTVPAVLSWIGLTHVLQALLQEDIGIGNLQAIVEALSRRDLQHDGIDECVEIARCSLSAQIGDRFLAGESALRVLVAAAQAEALLHGGLQRAPSGNLLTLDPESLQHLLAAVRQQMHALGDTAAGVVLLVADSRVRPYLRRLVMLEFRSCMCCRGRSCRPACPSRSSASSASTPKRRESAPGAAVLRRCLCRPGAAPECRVACGPPRRAPRSLGRRRRRARPAAPGQRRGQRRLRAAIADTVRRRADLDRPGLARGGLQCGARTRHRHPAGTRRRPARRRAQVSARLELCRPARARCALRAAALLKTMRERCGDADIVLPDEEAIEAPSPLAAVAHPLVLELGAAWEHPPLRDEDIALMFDGLVYELGVHFPPLELRADPTLPPWGLRVLINEVPELELQAAADAVLVNENVDALARLGIDAQPTLNPANGAPAAWVASAQRDRLQGKDLIIWDHRQFLILTLSAVLRGKAADFMGVAEAQALLALIEPAFPQLVAQTVPDPVSPLVLTDVLRRLLAEDVCIRNLRNILMTLADRGRSENDPLMLTEYVRAGLRRQLRPQLGRGQKLLVVFLLDPEIERQVRKAITHTATGSYVKLAPKALSAILKAIHAAAQAVPPGVQVPRILTTLDIRSSIRRLVAPSLPLLQVVSYNDLRPDIDIQPVGRITLQGFRPRPGVRVGDELLWG